MQKVKIFHGAANAEGLQILEDEVNVWLSKHNTIQIDDQQVLTVAGVNSESSIHGPIIHCTIAIFYRNV